MKILLMGHVDGLGGAQTAFRKLVDFCIEEKHEIKIIPITDFKSISLFEDKVVVCRILHHTLTNHRRLKKIFQLTYACIAARRLNPDIFISVGLSNSPNLIAKCLSDGCFKIAQDFIAGRTNSDELLGKSRRVFNGIAVQSPSMLDNFLSDGINTRGFNWLPCFPELPVENVLHKKSEHGDEFCKISYFGRLAGNKGLTILLQSFASVFKFEKVTLDIWGTGSEESNLKDLVTELGLNNQVSLRGIYPDTNKAAELMSSYDALVLTSTGMEGLPLILIEAMAYGIPFLATDIGAIKDCCINNPDTVLVQPNINDIAAGLKHLVQKIRSGEFDPLRQRGYYEKNYSYDVMAARWRKCLSDPKAFFNGQ